MARNRGGTESIKKKIRALEQAKYTLPDVLANDMVTFFKLNFRKQGFDDNATQRWPGRKGEITGGVAKVNKKSAGSRAILVKTGDLRNSIAVKFANWKRIRIESALPYSAIHNLGLKGNAFGKHEFKMPQRKFMGRSYHLNKKTREKMERLINGVMRA